MEFFGGVRSSLIVMRVYGPSLFYNVICWYGVLRCWCRRTCIVVMLAANPVKVVELSYNVIFK
jgi:hypothetical protein